LEALLLLALPLLLTFAKFVAFVTAESHQVQRFTESDRTWGGSAPCAPPRPVVFMLVKAQYSVRAATFSLRFFTSFSLLVSFLL